MEIFYHNQSPFRDLKLTFAFWCKFTEEAVWQTGSRVGTNENGALVTAILNCCANINTGRDNGRIWWTFWFATGQWTMLAHKVQIGATFGVRPEEAFCSIKS